MLAMRRAKVLLNFDSKPLNNTRTNRNLQIQNKHRSPFPCRPAGVLRGCRSLAAGNSRSPPRTALSGSPPPGRECLGFWGSPTKMLTIQCKFRPFIFSKAYTYSSVVFSCVKKSLLLKTNFASEFRESLLHFYVIIFMPA